MFFRSSKWADSTWGYVFMGVFAAAGLYDALWGSGSLLLPRPAAVVVFGFILVGAATLLLTEARDRKRRRSPRRRTSKPPE